MKFWSLILAVVLTATVASPAAAAQRKPHRERLPRQIACTPVGCNPVPPDCHPQIGYFPDGTPTGYDVVVCPWYR